MTNRIISQPDHGDQIMNDKGSPNNNLQVFIDDFVQKFNLQDDDVVQLNADVAQLKLDVAQLQTDVVQLVADVERVVGVEQISSTDSGVFPIDLVSGYAELSTSGGGTNNFSLADGVIGQRKTIILVVDGGTARIDPDTGSTFDIFNAGNMRVIVFTTGLGWILESRQPVPN